MTSNRTRTSWARWACRLLGTAALAALFTPTVTRAADTTQNFTATYPSTLGGFLRVVDEANDTRGQVGFSQLAGHTGAFDSLKFNFEIRFTKPVGGADGMSFVYLPVATNGASGSTPDLGEEPNLPGAFGVGFDTWSNSDQDSTPDGSLPDSFSLHFNGAKVPNVGGGLNNGSVPTTSFGLPQDWLENTKVKQAAITVTPGVGGSNVHMLVTEPATGISVQPFGAGAGTFVPGFLPYDGRMGFTARTGGENQNADLDKITATFDPAGAAGPISTAFNFDSGAPAGVTLTGTQVVAGVTNPHPPVIVAGDMLPIQFGGTQFTATNQGGIDPAQPLPQAESGHVVPDSAVPAAGGTLPGYYRLTEESRGGHNNIAFDKTLPTLTDGQVVYLDFDMRIRDVSGGFADGMSAFLLDTSRAEVGNSGPYTMPGPATAEDPNFPGAVGLAFDTFDNDENFVAGDPNGCGGGGPCVDRLGNISSVHGMIDPDGAGPLPAAPGQIAGQFIPDDAADTPGVANDTIRLVDGHWLHISAQILALDNGAGGLGGLLDVTMTDLQNGNTFSPFSGVGLGYLPKDLRLGFGARTGGAWDFHEIDNVRLSLDAPPVPEPSTFVLLGLAGTGLYVLRRKRK